ncbi:MAG: asparagine synthase (glutamine-hydrolyzing) [Rhodospirillales bacterium]
MCGIAGYRVSRPVDPRTVESMLSAIVHRGPDSQGILADDECTLGMRRLAINDLEHGDQPLYNADRSVAVVYNGEIYNAPALRRRLETQGHTIPSHSDGAVIPFLYDAFGEDLFEQLDGMFAVALWDKRRKRLILARDLPGEKPLYFAETPHGLAFASEIKALRLFPEIDTEINWQAIWDFPTFTWIPEPETIYRSVSALPRGHLLVSDPQGYRIRPYENRFNRQTLDHATDEEIVAETRKVVEDSVKSRLLSDVPIGSFLSSGLDSSIVATLASRELNHLDTFTIGFEDLDDPYHGHSDESSGAEALASHLGTRHHTIRVTADIFRDMLDDFVHYGDQPFAVPSGLGIFAIAQAARNAGLKVLLSGDGADECFGGYSWYINLRDAEMARPPKSNGQTAVGFHDVGIPLEDRLADLAAMPAHERARAWHYYAHEEEKKDLFHPDLSSRMQTSSRHFAQHKADLSWPAEEFVAQDRNFYFPFEMMRKVDRMTMACSVEGRVPFAAPSVLSHAEKLRYEHMVRSSDLKWALRSAFADLLPEEVVKRPKHGFNVPLHHWLKEGWKDLVEETFSPTSALSRMSIINDRAADNARAMLDHPHRLNGPSIFSFIILNRWLENEHG